MALPDQTPRQPSPSPPVRALVSGASSGIGSAFCRQLAATCTEVLITGRNRDALDALANELSALEVTASVIPADLTTTIGRARLVETIRQCGPLRYLINCAGFGTLGSFSSRDPVSQEQMVRLHIDATLSLCRAALAGMRENGGGYVVNVSSLAALTPTRGLAVYSGTTAFLTTFSEALQQEVQEQRIKVQCLCPGDTRTEFFNTDQYSDFATAEVPDTDWMDAGEVAAASLEALHGDDQRVLVIPGAINRQLARRSLERQLADLGAET